MPVPIGHDPGMPRPSRRLLQDIGDFVIPWGVGLFLVLTVVDEQATPTSWLPLSLGVILAVLQGAAPRR